jgi:diacylglycerol kinase (ATP)
MDLSPNPPRRALLIVNPVAGQGRLLDATRVLDPTLHRHIADVSVTNGPGDAESAAARAAQSDRRFDAVLVAGGDGTVNEVINGLLGGRSDGRSPLPLGILPMGTQNVLAQELGIPLGNVEGALAVLDGGRLQVVDAGKAANRYFMLMAGFGFDAAVVNDVVRPIKQLIGPAAYAIASLGALARFHSTAVRLRLDTEVVSTQAYLVVVANASSYAFGQIKLAPFASMTDGWLDICVFERAPTAKVGFVTQIAAVLARRHLHDPRVRYYRARKIVVESYPPVQGQLDGDTFQNTPLTIEVAPHALPIFVPESTLRG